MKTSEQISKMPQKERVEYLLSHLRVINLVKDMERLKITENLSNEEVAQRTHDEAEKQGLSETLMELMVDGLLKAVEDPETREEALGVLKQVLTKIPVEPKE